MGWTAPVDVHIQPPYQTERRDFLGRWTFYGQFHAGFPEQLTLRGPILFLRMNSFGHGSKPLVLFWGRCTTHFRIYFSGWIESDVHWGYDFDVDPYPFRYVVGPFCPFCPGVHGLQLPRGPPRAVDPT